MYFNICVDGVGTHPIQGLGQDFMNENITADFIEGVLWVQAGPLPLINLSLDLVQNIPVHQHMWTEAEYLLRNMLWVLNQHLLIFWRYGKVK